MSRGGPSAAVEAAAEYADICKICKKKYAKIWTVFVKYARNMHEICTKYAYICNQYALICK